MVSSCYNNEKTDKNIADVNRFRTDVSYCTRCGTCCKKGGPAFHLEDMHLIETGKILLRHLYTIRKEEIAYDNITKLKLPADSDIIKIKSLKNSWTCLFFDDVYSSCKIYENRPVECQVLKCWDTQEIEQIYSKNRITRKDLLSKVEGLWDIICEHQLQCSYEKFISLTDKFKKKRKENILNEIIYIIQYDMHIRSLAVEKVNTDPDMLNFLFGRSFVDTISAFGFRIYKKKDKYHLVVAN